LEVVDIPDLKDPNLTADTAVSIAVQARPEIRAQKRTISALENTRLATEASDDPTLAVGSQFTRQLGEVGLNTQRSSMVGTITLSIPITATGIVRKQVQQARQDEQLAQIQLKQLELNVSAEVRSALTNLTSARTRYNSATQQVALAEEVYRISIVRRDAGEATYVEVIDAQTSLTQARNQLNAARFDYLTAYSQLQRAVGSDNFSLPADAATPNRATPNGANSK
jgi:outer membrane protein